MASYICLYCGKKFSSPPKASSKDSFCASSPIKKHKFANKGKSEDKDPIATFIGFCIVFVGLGIYQFVMWFIETFGMVLGIVFNVILLGVIVYGAFVVYRKTKMLWLIVYLVIVTIGVSVAGFYLPEIKINSQDETKNEQQIQNEPKQEVAKVQAQAVEKPTKTQTAEPQTATPPTQTQTQIQSESTANAPSVDYEQKFGKRIYLATKDEFVNMRNAPSGEIVAKIYKKDFADIMLYSFDTNSNEKWLKVVYFPPNAKDEQSAISGYIHISQIDKNKLN